MGKPASLFKHLRLSSSQNYIFLIHIPRERFTIKHLNWSSLRTSKPMYMLFMKQNALFLVLKTSSILISSLVLGQMKLIANIIHYISGLICPFYSQQSSDHLP